MNIILWLVLGLFLGTLLLIFARAYPLRAELKILANSLVIAAIIYVFFAFLWGNTTWLVIELIGIPAYGLLAWLSLRFSSYYLALGWLLHPIWDIFLHLLGPGHTIVPVWYAVTCVSFDILISMYVFYRSPQWKLMLA